MATEHSRVLVVQHEDQCPPGWFGRWLEDAGCVLDVRRPYAGVELPRDLHGHAGLLVLGGHMGAYDDARFGWLTRVKELVRHAATDGVPTLGICLGHQLVAVALGGSVTVNPRGQQLGVLPIGWRDEPDELFASLPRVGIQWNDDVVDSLPEGAVVLAGTEAGELQVVRFAPTVWGVQAHPEADCRIVEPWAEHDRARQGDAAIDAALVEVVQAEPELLADWQRVAASLARHFAERARRHGGARPGAELPAS